MRWLPTLLVLGALPALAGATGSPEVEAGAPGTEASATISPPELVVDARALYPEELASQAISGEATLELSINESGDVDSVSVKESSHEAFGEAARKAAPNLKFKPAMQDGKPLPVRILFTYRFQAPPPKPAEPPAGTLKVLVRAKGSRRPLSGAIIHFTSPAGSEEVAETDATGHLTLTLRPGEHPLRVSAPGHRPATHVEKIGAGETLEVVYGLEPLVVSPYETIVYGDRERTEISRITLRAEELREVAGTMGDPFRVVMLLPGVSSTLSGVSYPVVRGSLPAATGYFLDGIRIPILFHLFLGPAVFHPDFIDVIDFYPGAPPPQHGRLMGGVIEGKSSRPREDRIHATAYVDIINAGLFFEAPFEQTGTSVTLSGRYSYTPWLLALVANSRWGDPNTQSVLDFYDYQGRIEQKIGPGSLRLLSFGSSDVTGTIAKTDMGVTALNAIVFHRLDLRYRQPLETGEFEVGAAVGWDRLTLNVDSSVASADFRLSDRSYQFRARWNATLHPQWKLAAGGDFERRESQILFDATLPGTGAPVGFGGPPSVGSLAGLWSQAQWTGVPQLTLLPGLRIDNYHLVPGINHFVLEPRLTARYQLSEEWTLKGGGGLYHQPPAILVSLPAADMAALRYGLQEGIQLDVGVEWKQSRGLEVNADVYFNPLLRTLEFALIDKLDSLPVPGDPDSDEAVRRQITHGYAYGFELMIRHPLGGNWFGWLSYTYQQSVRRKEFIHYNEYGEPDGTRTNYLPFIFDQSHVLNAVVSRKFEGGWTVGGSIHFNTGVPEYGGVLSGNTHVEGVDRDGQPRWIPVDADRSDRLPPFLRIDARVAKAWAFDHFFLEAYLDVLNLTLSQEVVGYQYASGNASAPGLIKAPLRFPPVFLPVLGIKMSY